MRKALEMKKSAETRLVQEQEKSVVIYFTIITVLATVCPSVPVYHQCNTVLVDIMKFVRHTRITEYTVQYKTEKNISNIVHTYAYK